MRVSIFDPITLKQGTIYTLSNANDLLTKSLYDTNLRVTPSAFACINLPEWHNTYFGDEQTFYVPYSMFGASQEDSPNVFVPTLLQNYLDNCSLYATEHITEDNVIFTESAFWKMLQTSWTFAPEQDLSTGAYVQKSTWNDIVTYVGKPIDLGLQTLNGQTYSEMFMYIPRNAKRVKAIWKTMSYQGLNQGTLPTDDYEDTQYACGLQPGDATYINAVYDLNANNTMSQHYTVSLATDRLQLDFDNLQTVDGDITFNCILIYADIWDIRTPDIKQRFLHSIYFLSMFEDSGTQGSWTLPAFTKTAQSVDNTANAFAFRLCTRMTGCNTTYKPIEVSSIDGISLDMYMDSIQRLANQSNAIEKLAMGLKTVQKQYDDLVVGLGINENALTIVNELKQSIMQQGIYVAPNDLLDMFINVSNAMKASDKQVIVNINVQQI